MVAKFFTRGEESIPTAWIKRIRESMATLTPRFSAERAEREYAETYYIPAARAVTDYTPRVIQRSEGLGGEGVEGGISVPLQGDRILWQK